MSQLKNHFRPEFLNRLDEIVMFKPLSKSDIRGIIDLLVKDINRRIEDKEISLTLRIGRLTTLWKKHMTRYMVQDR